MKKCIDCNTEKVDTEYHRRTDNGRLASYCKSCSNIRSQKNRHKLSEDNSKRYCNECKEWLEIIQFQEFGQNKFYKQCKACTIELVLKGVLKKSVILDNLKLCLKCYQLLPLDFFKPANKGIGNSISYCNSCIKEYHQSKYDKELSKQQSYEWRSENREQYLAQHRIHQFNRKNLIKASDDKTLTPKVLKEIYARTHCCYCKNFIETNQRTLEHVIPLSQGGVHSVNNVDMSCFSCNSSKQAKPLKEWIKKFD